MRYSTAENPADFESLISISVSLTPVKRRVSPIETAKSTAMADHQQSPPNGMSTPWPEETGVWGKYQLHCHCGAIRYSIKISPPLYEEEAEGTSTNTTRFECAHIRIGKGIYQPSACNCSYCERNGYIAVHPKTSNIEWIQGLEDRTEYLYGNKKCPQWFCRKCGSVVGTDLTYLMEKVFHAPAAENSATVNVSVSTRLWRGCVGVRDADRGIRCAC